MLTIDATNLPRFMQCNASITMPKVTHAVDLDTTVRDEGNAAHWLASVVYNNEFDLLDMGERKAPNGVWITSDMIEHVENYLELIRNRHYEQSSQIEHDVSIITEHFRINARADHIGHSIYTDDSTLYVDDFKYGWSLKEPELDWTLLAYAIGYVFQRQITPASIQFTIYQPRPFHVHGPMRPWTITYAELMFFWQRIQETLTHPTETLQTGPNCRRCLALANCPAARGASLNAIDVSQNAHGEILDNQALDFELETLHTAKAAIDNRLKALKEEGLHRCMNGQVLEHYGLGETQSNRVFKEGITPEMVQMLTGIDLTIKKLPTPAEAERRGVDKILLSTLTERKKTGSVLVRGDANKRAQRILGKKT